MRSCSPHKSFCKKMRIQTTRHAWIFACFSFAIVCSCSRDPGARELAHLKRGRELLAARNYQRALIEFRNASQATPQDPEPYYQIGMVALEQGDMKRGIASFDKALSLNLKHAPAKLQLAGLMTATGNKDLIEKAQASVREVLASSPDKVNALELLGAGEFELGKPAEAEEHLEEAVKRAPRHIMGAVMLARLQLSRGGRQAAEATVRRMAAANSRSAQAHLAAAQFYGSLGRSAEGRAELTRAVELEPKNPAALLALASLAFQEGRERDAEQLYQRLSVCGDVTFQGVHADYLLSRGRISEATAELERLAKGRDDSRLRTQLVALYIATGRTKDADEILKKALHRNARDTSALLQRGALRIRSRNYAEAEADLAAVLHFNPSQPAAHYLMARLHAARGAKARTDARAGYGDPVSTLAFGRASGIGPPLHGHKESQACTGNPRSGAAGSTISRANDGGSELGYLGARR